MTLGRSLCYICHMKGGNMEGLLTKMLLFFFCAYPLKVSQEKEIALILVVACLFVAVELVQDRVKDVLYGAFCLLCYWDHTLLAFVPLLLYDNFWKNPLWGIMGFFALVLGQKDWRIYYAILLGIGSYQRIREKKIETESMNHIQEMDDLREQLLQREETLLSQDKMMENQVHIAILQERNRIAREIHDSV